MNAKTVAALSGVSVRTLHYYDSIGLIQPTRDTENGYRRYTQADIDTLQQVLFFRECGFRLKVIKDLITSDGYNRLHAFELQKKYLLHEKHRIDSVLRTLDKSIRHMKGEITMSNKDKFDGFDFSKNPYEEEARQMWGDAAVDRSTEHISSLSPQEQGDMSAKMDKMFSTLAGVMNLDPASEAVQCEIKKMFEFFNSGFGYTYSPQAFAGLGMMYVQDARFTKNIDKYGNGLSLFLSKAMGIYAESIS